MNPNQVLTACRVLQALLNNSETRWLLSATERDALETVLAAAERPLRGPAERNPTYLIPRSAGPHSINRGG